MSRRVANLINLNRIRCAMRSFDVGRKMRSETARSNSTLSAPRSRRHQVDRRIYTSAAGALRTAATAFSTSCAGHALAGGRRLAAPRSRQHQIDRRIHTDAAGALRAAATVVSTCGRTYTTAGRRRCTDSTRSTTGSTPALPARCARPPSWPVQGPPKQLAAGTTMGMDTPPCCDNVAQRNCNQLDNPSVRTNGC